MRETASAAKVILPVWHGLTYAEVAQYSPLLADRIAISTSGGLDVVVAKVLEALSPRLTNQVPAVPREQEWVVILSGKAKRERVLRVSKGDVVHIIEYRTSFFSPYLVIVDGIALWEKLTTLPTRLAFELADTATKYRAVLEADTDRLDAITKLRLTVNGRVLYSEGY